MHTTFYAPKTLELSEITEKVEDLQVKIANEQRLNRNLKKYKKEVEELNLQLKRALLELPDKREIPDLLSSISGLARDAGLEVRLFRTNPEQLREFYAEVPVEIGLNGTFHQITSFFDEVAHLTRIVNIDQIQLSKPEVNSAEVKISAECVATTFRYLDEDERRAQEEAG